MYVTNNIFLPSNTLLCFKVFRIQQRHKCGDKRQLGQNSPPVGSKNERFQTSVFFYATGQGNNFLVKKLNSAKKERLAVYIVGFYKNNLL